MNRGGQLKISFGMIFSIILIIMFLSLGFYSISQFLELQERVKTEKFVDKLQDEIDSMWSSQVYGSTIHDFSLPDSVEKICFVDREKNLEIWKNGIPSGRKIENIDIIKILDGKRTLCMRISGGKVELKIEQEYGKENSITVSEIKNE